VDDAREWFLEDATEPFRAAGPVGGKTGLADPFGYDGVLLFTTFGWMTCVVDCGTEGC